ncbi:hypothetical protein BC830DRAFT_298855 [Chytriomyces sp. MP71]|nr:hypothetical protein BC830DRAFT_298855 [Chytriomyces sp. MP71]
MAKKEEKSNRNRREEEEIDRAGKRKHHGGSAEESVGRGSPKRRMRSPPSSSDDSQSDRGESSSTRRALRDNNRRVEPNRERGYKEDWRRAGRREDLDSERHASRDNDHRDDTSRHYRDDVQDKRRYPERSYADRRAVDDRRDDNGDLYGSQRRPREQTGRDKDRCLDNAPASRESERSWDERSRCGHGVNRDQASQNSGDSAAPIKGVMDESKRIKLEAMLANAK